jgi:hypothetical protein
VPELPDVEGYARLLQSCVVGQRIDSVKVLDPGVVRAPSSKVFARRLKGRRFSHPDRRGKWLLARTDGPTLLLHFGMTGRLVWEDHSETLQRFDRVAISLEDGTLIFRDQRKLGGLWLANSEESIREIIGDQGPDALGLTGRRFEERQHPVRRGAVASRDSSAASLWRTQSRGAAPSRPLSPTRAASIRKKRSDSEDRVVANLAAHRARTALSTLSSEIEDEPDRRPHVVLVSCLSAALHGVKRWPATQRTPTEATQCFDLESFARCSFSATP